MVELAAIAHLPRLRRLSVLLKDGTDWKNVLTALPPNPFPSLQELRIVSTTIIQEEAYDESFVRTLDMFLEHAAKFIRFSHLDVEYLDPEATDDSLRYLCRIITSRCPWLRSAEVCVLYRPPETDSPTSGAPLNKLTSVSFVKIRRATAEQLKEEAMKWVAHGSFDNLIAPRRYLKAVRGQVGTTFSRAVVPA